MISGGARGGGCREPRIVLPPHQGPNVTHSLLPAGGFVSDGQYMIKNKGRSSPCTSEWPPACICGG